MGLTLFLATSCRGWDDDSGFAIRTRASFFLAPANGGNTLLRYADGEMQVAWNTKAGIPDVDLSDVDLRKNALWMSSGRRNLIAEVHPETGEVLRNFDNLPMAPHYLTVGEEQILAVDTIANSIMFIRIRNGKVTAAQFEGQPRFSIYSNSRFFLKNFAGSVSIIDEKALTARETLSFGNNIQDIQTNRYNNIYVLTSDSTAKYWSLIPGNADYIERDNLPANYDKVRYTPYFSGRYGTEYLNDLQLVGSEIQTTKGTLLIPDADNFEVDFFGGSLFYTRADSMYVYDLNGETVLDSFPFAFSLENAWHQYGQVE